MKKIFSFILALNIVILSWALPMFDSYLDDYSGEYVYYKDNTFFRESYIGILYYNDSTMKLRYYAPRDYEQKLPENEVVIAVTINPESENMELTGEQFLTTVIPGSDNVDIVNYLHDILYDFTANRKRIIALNERDIIISQDLIGFGGRVNITYDCTIPIFNIREINDPTGKSLFHCVTTGKLQDSNDSSFDAFKGFGVDNSKKGKERYKKDKSIVYTMDNQSITLDSAWEPIMENFWTRGDDAILTLSSVSPISEDDDNLNEMAFIKKFIQSTPLSYTNFDTLSISKDDNDKLKISVEVYQPLKENRLINVKIIAKNKNSTSYDILSLPIFKEPYLTNKKYYDMILESYNN